MKSESEPQPYRPQPPSSFDLPSPEQLENFRAISSFLRGDPDGQEEGDLPYELSREEKDAFFTFQLESVEAFRDLILGLPPNRMESWEVDWVQRTFPLAWKRYQEGDLDESRAAEDERQEQLLRQGWERGAFPTSDCPPYKVEPMGGAALFASVLDAIYGEDARLGCRLIGL